jgi:tRNA-dihydrouridine synthase
VRIVNKGCGVELMTDPRRAGRIVRAMREAGGVPVSAKLRLGADAVRLDSVADALLEAGVDALAVHGRTARQKYDGRADWEPVVALASRSPVPVIGSGDVTDAAQARARMAQGVGVMVGRGALGRPWLFAEVARGDVPSTADKVRTMVRHAELHVAWYGREAGLRSLRGHLANYAKGVDATGRLRDEVVRVHTVHELMDALMRHGLPVAADPVPVRGAWENDHTEFRVAGVSA